MTALVRDNKQPKLQSRRDTGRGKSRVKKMKEIESDKKRQRGYEALQQL